MTFKNIIRIIKRDSLSLVTNMTGLSLGLAASILLTAFILFELSYDRHFSKSDQIYRLNSVWIEDGERSEMVINLREAYTEIPEEIAGIENSIQIYRGFQREVIQGDSRYKNLNLLYSDPDFFKLFDLELIEGSPDNALIEPNSVVLTEKIAQRIFGKTSVIGESFTMEEELYTISAVVANLPPNTHFRFDMLMPMLSIPNLEQFGGLEFLTYYLLEEAVTPEPVLASIAAENTRILTKGFSSFEGATFESRLEPLKGLHLHTAVDFDLSPPGSMRTIYIMLIITLAVMGLALSNFINLYILNGAKRSKEIGVRKVNGAGRRQMIWHFYLETTTVVTISFVVGAIISLLLLPAFAKIMQRDSFMEVTGTPSLYLILLVIYLFTILLSGLYPALLLSRATPLQLIRGAINPAGDKRILVRIVSVLQACIAVSLLSILLGVNTQISFLKKLSPGYNPEQVVMIYNLNQKLSINFPALRDKLLMHPDIEEVAASSHTIGGGASGQGIRMYGEDPDKIRSIAEYRIRPGLCQVYQFTLIAGRFLDPHRKPDNQGVILNEAAVKMLGYTPQNIVGESVIMHSNPLEVIGVVEDFYFETAARNIEALLLTAYSDAIWHIPIRYKEGVDPQLLLQSVTETFRTFDPDYILMNRFATDIYKAYYSDEERVQKILLFGSLLSVLIVLLGIYALVSHNMVARTKEIGIRKVMGASSSEMISLIYTSTLKWTILAALLAVPLSWFYMHSWLSNYAVRIPIYWWIFVISIALVVLFQSLITLGQTRRTARRNPVDALRYE